MMDAITFTANSFRRLLVSVFKLVYNRVNGRATWRYRRARYPSFLLARFVFKIKTIQKFHWNINCWTEAEAVAWKDSFASSCTAVAVAAAIFAGIGVTSLQLPNINNTLWVTRALFSVSMALGILSVITATILQRTVYTLGNHVAIRLWLSRGKTRPRLDYGPPYCDLPLESSATVLTLTEAPSRLLNLAALVYLAGFLLYYRYGWSGYENTNADALEHNKYIFIVVCSVVGLALVYLILLWIGQAIDEEKRNKYFGLDEQEHDGETNSELLHLEEWLEALKRLPRRDQKSSIEPGYDSVRAIRVNLENRRRMGRETSPRQQLSLWGSDEDLVRDTGFGSTSLGAVREKAGNETTSSNIRAIHRNGSSDDRILPVP